MFNWSCTNLQALLDKKASEADMLEVKEKLSNIPSDLMDQLDQMAKNMESLRLDRDSVSAFQIHFLKKKCHLWGKLVSFFF